VDWLLVALLFLVIYLLAVWYVKKKRIREDLIAFYGPIMAIKSHRIGFFDRFKPYTTLLRAYGTIGMAMVVVISVAMTALVIIAFRTEVVNPPPATGVFEMRNWFVIPGVNQFIPLTLPVLFGIIITIAIHEVGHGILCRVEGILVKSMGALLFVIPIGFFVEPDEEELERAPPVPKSRMYGAGIANNLVLGFACFGILILLLGMVTAVPGPIIYMVQVDSPAYNASVPLGSVILAIDGEKISSPEDISHILSGTKPGDTLGITVVPAGVLRDLPPPGPEPPATTYNLSLGSAPDRTYGYMGVNYYDTPRITGVLRGLGSPGGFALLCVLPVDIVQNQWPPLHVILMYTPDEAFFRAPFPLYWAVVHFFFWCGWFNFMVGTFNALPMVPFDGGFIMREGVSGLFRRIGKPQLADRVVLAVSFIILTLIILVVTIPSIAKLLTMVGPG